MRRWILVASLLAACGDDGGASPHDAAGSGDGGGGDGGAVDAPIDGRAFDCATSPTAGAHKIFLNFDGVTLTKDMNMPSNSATGVVPFLGQNTATATIGAWRMAAGDRAAQIADVVCMMRQSFFAFDVEFVTTRPASGDYEMIVLGGKPMDVGQAAGVSSITGVDCTNMNQRDVSWIAEFFNNDTNTLTPRATANGASAMLGVDNGLAASKGTHNCMCNVASSETIACDDTMICNFESSSMIPTGGNSCGAQTVEDQNAKLVARYGARP